MGEERNTGTFQVVMAIVAAYLFSALARLLLLREALAHPEYSFGGNIIPLWTADAGYIGAHAKWLLAGEYVPFDNEHAAGHLIAWLSKLSGFGVDQVMFFAPALLAPLIVVPIILIMALYGRTFTGMAAAMLASIGFNFYFRTHLGYTDTDMLNFFFVYMILYGMIAVAERRGIAYVLIGFVSIILLGLWYHSYKPLVLGTVAFYFLYVILFDRKQTAHYFALAMYAAAFAAPGVWLKIVAGLSVLLVWTVLSKKAEKYLDYRYWLSAAAAGAAVLAVFVAINPQFYWRILSYANKAQSVNFTDAAGKHYALAGSLQEIAEAKGMPLADVLTYISGHYAVFAVGVIGLIGLAWGRRSSVLLWPMLLLGVAASILGVRFTTFAVPVIAIGVFVVIAALNRMLSGRFGRLPGTAAAALLSVALFAYAFSVLDTYNKVIKPVYASDEAEMMQQLAEKGSVDDFVVSWWDNGWPLWYGTGKRTLIDNGKHGLDNYLVARMWFSGNPVLTANTARYFLGLYDKHYSRESILRRVAGREDLDALLQTLSRRPLAGKPPFDIYFYFSDDLIEKLPRIAAFASLGGPDPFANELLSYTPMRRPFRFEDQTVEAAGVSFDRRNGIVRTADGQQGRVSRLIVSDGESIKVQQFYRNSDYNLIVYKNRYLLMLTDGYLNTFVIKGLLLNQFDPQLFALEKISQHGKILHLK